MNDQEILNVAVFEALHSVYGRITHFAAWLVIHYLENDTYELKSFPTVEEAHISFVRWQDYHGIGHSRAIGIIGAYDTPQAGIILAQLKRDDEATIAMHSENAEGYSRMKNAITFIIDGLEKHDQPYVFTSTDGLSPNNMANLILHFTERGYEVERDGESDAFLTVFRVYAAR